MARKKEVTTMYLRVDQNEDIRALAERDRRAIAAVTRDLLDLGLRVARMARANSAGLPAWEES